LSLFLSYVLPFSAGSSTGIKAQSLPSRSSTEMRTELGTVFGGTVNTVSFFALGEADEGKAMAKLRGMESEQGDCKSKQSAI
jgi:hypothetical protein